MLTTPIRKTAMAVAALGALGLGGSAIAAAGTSGTGSSSASSSSQTQTQTRDHGQRQALSAADAAKVTAAAIDKVPGATVLETEAGGPNGTAYHAHIRTSDGKLEDVLVNATFQATAVQADNGRGGGRHGGPGHGNHAAETPLTGDPNDHVAAAVTAKYPGAPIACLSFPHCGANPAVAESAPRAVQMTHRILAILLVLHLIGLALGVARRKEGAVVVRAARAAMGLGLLQIVVAEAILLPLSEITVCRTR